MKHPVAAAAANGARAGRPRRASARPRRGRGTRSACPRRTPAQAGARWQLSHVRAFFPVVCGSAGAMSRRDVFEPPAAVASIVRTIPYCAGTIFPSARAPRSGGAAANGPDFSVQPPGVSWPAAKSHREPDAENDVWHESHVGTHAAWHALHERRSCPRSVWFRSRGVCLTGRPTPSSLRTRIQEEEEEEEREEEEEEFSLKVEEGEPRRPRRSVGRGEKKRVLERVSGLGPSGGRCRRPSYPFQEDLLFSPPLSSPRISRLISSLTVAHETSPPSRTGP